MAAVQLDERFVGRIDHGEELGAVGSEFGIEGIHQVFFFLPLVLRLLGGWGKISSCIPAWLRTKRP